VGPSPLLDAVPRLAAADAAQAGRLVARCLRDDREAPARSALVQHYLGSADGADALERFLAACEDLVARRDAAQATLAGVAT
jgi:hypothetical protein